MIFISEAIILAVVTSSKNNLKANMECDHPIDDGVLRQGDIFVAHPGTPNWQDPWRRFGVILSADCDIAQGKTGKNLVQVPIIGLNTYLADVWIPDQAGKLHQQALDRLEKTLTEFNEPKVTPRHALAWDDDALISALSKPQTSSETDRQKKIKRVISLRTAIREVEQLCKPAPNSKVGQLPQMLELLFPTLEVITSPPNPGRAYRQKLLFGALCALSNRDRLDTWPILDLIGLDPEMRDDEQSGFVIDLRRFTVIPVANVLTSRQAWLVDTNAYLRVCRLRGIYKTDLMQRFANLFLRVGLEDRREENHKHMFDRLAKKLVPGDF